MNAKEVYEKSVIDNLLRQIERHPGWDVSRLRAERFFSEDHSLLTEYLMKMSRETDFIRFTYGSDGTMDIHDMNFNRLLSTVVVRNELRELGEAFKNLVGGGAHAFL